MALGTQADRQIKLLNNILGRIDGILSKTLSIPNKPAQLFVLTNARSKNLCLKRRH
jgi:hypothetical protein